MGTEKRIYNRIKVCLAARHVRSNALAEHMGVSKQTVSKWCTNYKQPTVPELFDIAEFLNLSVSELLVQNELR